MSAERSTARAWLRALVVTLLAAALCGIDAAPAGTRGTDKVSTAKAGDAAAAPAPLVLTAEERAWLAAHPVLRVGVAAVRNQIEIVQHDGRYSGISGDLMNLVATRLGVTLQPVPYPTLPQRLDALAAGAIDLVPALSLTRERERRFRMTRAYMDVPVVYVARRDTGRVVLPNDLKNLRIAVDEGGAAHERLVEAGLGARLVVVPTREEALRAVADGRADTHIGPLPQVAYALDSVNDALDAVATGRAYAFATALPTASYLLAGGRAATLRIGFVPRELTMKRYFAVRNDNPDLAMISARGLQAITPAEHLALQSKWAALRPPEEIDWRQVWRRLWLPALLIVGVLALALAWARRLAREIRLRRAAETELVAAKERAERMARVKEEFLAVATHEIRAPVGAISCAINRLAQLAADAHQRELLQITRRSVDALTEFVNNVLDLSKSEAGKLTLNPRPDDLRALFTEVEAGFGPLAAERGNRLLLRIGELPACLHFDAMRVRQIVVNLLSNALKFTEDGTVTIDVHAQPSATADRCTVNIVVADDGIGIAPDQLQRLFEPYAQLATGAASRFGGTGLGLSICKRLAEAMGGTIEMASRWREGTAVTVRLPLSIVEDAAAPPPSSPASTRVLIADDDPVQQILMTATMRQLGVDPEIAAHGREALERWKERRQDVVFTDCRMPHMDGYDLARALKAAGGPGVRVIGMSADADEAATALSAGMEMVLQKPVSVEQLRRALGMA